MSRPSHFRRPKIVAALVETFGFSPLLATIVALFLLVLAAAAILWVVLSAPPRVVTIASGPAGSSFQRYAEHYRDALAPRGIILNILPSEGSRDNLLKLTMPDSGVDLALVQGGLVADKPPPGVVSLGSVSFQPLWVFYRGDKTISLLSELVGKRVDIGAKGSGVQMFARALLEANGITGAPTTFVEDDSADAASALLAGRVDAVFLMGDSVSTQTLGVLLRAPGVHVYEFVQADAYIRHRLLATLNLNKIVLPQGAIDLGQNLPAEDITLVAPTVELVARETLKPATSDAILWAAQQWHSRPTIFARRGEFPAPLFSEFPLSEDAKRYYKSGQGITYSLVRSFWLASLINRLLVAIVPIFLVLIPAVRLLPVVYRWSIQLRIFRHYRPLLKLEREASGTPAPGEASELVRRLDAIERDVDALKVPASYASQFYDLRSHVALVRQRLKAATDSLAAPKK
ncbi:MAG TPA: TAXI family TRAP transporter solute-binding subunit [Opitutaceae bacterium]|nr:TAXI family TRAP transporter solute-binding subunit [Opitutaceae bacterium]